MPGGVQTRFLQVLEADHAMAGRRAVLATVLLALLLVPAWFLHPPLAIAVFAGAAVVGALFGVLGSRTRSKRFEASIKDHWAHWMRFAMACESVPEIHTRVDGGSTRNRSALAAAALTAIWALEVALVVAAFQADASLAMVAPLAAANGLLVGALVGHAFHQRHWFDGLHRSVQELVESGELGVWGVL